MSRYKVLLTDYAWPDLDLEREILAEADAELVVAPESDEATLIRLADGVDAIMTNWAKVPESVISAASNCQIVSRLGIGLDNIDVAYCTSQKIPVTNVPDYCVIEVAEHTIAQLMSLGRKIAFYHHETQSGRYDLQAGDKLRRMEGQTLGIVGFGNIGRKVAEKALGLGMKVIAYSRSRRDPMPNVEYVEFEDLLKQSDYVTLHLPLTPETRHIIGAAELASMKPTAYLLNTARGGHIDTAALTAALAAGQIAGAALDVQEPEPCDLTQAPYNDPRVIITPHAAFVSQESLENLRSRVARQVAARLTGGIPESVVNAGVLQ